MITNRNAPNILQQLISLPLGIRVDVEAALDELEKTPLPALYTIISNSPKHVLRVNNTTEILYVADHLGRVTVVAIRRNLWSKIRASAGT